MNSVFSIQSPEQVITSLWKKERGRVSKNMHFGLKTNPETDSRPNHFKRDKAQMHGPWLLLQWGSSSALKKGSVLGGHEGRGHSKRGWSCRSGLKTSRSDRASHSEPADRRESSHLGERGRQSLHCFDCEAAFSCLLLPFPLSLVFRQPQPLLRWPSGGFPMLTLCRSSPGLFG